LVEAGGSDAFFGDSNFTCVASYDFYQVALEGYGMPCSLLCNVEPITFNEEGIRGGDLCCLTFLPVLTLLGLL